MLFRELIELDEKARNGDKQAARELDIAAQQLGYADYADLMERLSEPFARLADWVNRQFEGHPSEPVYLQLKAMARSQNSVHRAVARLSGELTLGELEKKAEEILKEEMMQSARELPAVQYPSGRLRSFTPEQRRLLDEACVGWANRGYLPNGNMSEYLNEFCTRTGLYITCEQFKEALKDAGRRGLIEKINGRWRPAKICTKTAP